MSAARSGHDAVMTPSCHCYFNVYQEDPETEPPSFRGQLNMKKVCSFELVPPTLTQEKASHITGAQGCLWTEYGLDGRQAEHMILPRLTALSEVMWSPPGKRNWEDFISRLRSMLNRFNIMGLNYHKGSFHVDMSASYDEASNSVILEMTSEHPSPEIRYTTDGSVPGQASLSYEAPARYVKVLALGQITCPPWHAGAGGKAWLFCDEIIVE